MAVLVMLVSITVVMVMLMLMVMMTRVRFGGGLRLVVGVMALHGAMLTCVLCRNTVRAHRERLIRADQHLHVFAHAAR